MNKILFMVILAVLIIPSYSLSPKKILKQVNIARDLPAQGMRTLCNISDWSYWVYHDGTGGNAPTGDPGGHFPGPDFGAIFFDGIIWGGYVQDGKAKNPRVGGVTYRVGTVNGWITANGTAIDPNDPRAVVYRIRGDFLEYKNNLEEFREDAAQLYMIDPSLVTSDQLQSVYDQYESDWNNWPVDLGAPYYDVNDNGVYDAGGIQQDLNGNGIIEIGEREEPGYARANQVIWYVANDLDASKTTYLYGSQPMGLEIQTTFWAYDMPGSYLNNAFFKKIKIINKSGVQIEDMYFGQWSDMDIGQYTNDFCGVDTVLQLAYTYNGSSEDDEFMNSGLAPTAAGYTLLQGPVVPSAGDSAIFENQILQNYKNLPITSFGFFAPGSAISDPPLGDYDGSLQFYNLLRGYLPTIDLEYPFPFIIGSGPDNGKPTKFPLSGDPFLNTGDIDGMGYNLPPGDRRFVLSTGPVSMAAGDIQELVFAVVGGSGPNYISSVTQLEQNVDNIRQGYIPVPPPIPIPVVGLGASISDQFIDFSWEDLSSIYPQQNYDLLGYKLYQVIPDPDSLIEIASFDKMDGITSVIDTVEGKEVIVYEGYENGLQTTYSTATDQIKEEIFQYGHRYSFGIQVYVSNSNAPTGTKVITNLLNPLSILFLPEGLKSEFYAKHTLGDGDGFVRVRLRDYSLLTGNNYSVTFSGDRDVEKRIVTLTDITKNEVIKTGPQLNFKTNEFGFEMAIKDSLGAITTRTEGNRWVSGVNWGGVVFYGALDFGGNFFGSDLEITDVEDVRLEFQDMDDVSSYGYISKGAVYRRDQGYAYEGSGELPIAAFEISDPANPRRLNICFVEDDNQEGVTANLIWDMGWNDSEFPDDLGGREYVFIMATDYDEGVSYNAQNDGTYHDVMYAFWPKKRTGTTYLQSEFSLTIVSGKGLNLSDVFEFNTDIEQNISSILKPDMQPFSFRLAQNYPNPFNPSTTINYSLAKAGHVKIVIYNILGQKVKTLVDNSMQAGNFKVIWNGMNQSNQPVGSGTYFYVIRTGDFKDVKRMVLIR